jgi:nicotinamide-nucleotide amidase
MRAEVIAVGDELTSGQRLDTNSQWISQQLGELGIRVLYHTTVGDELDAEVDVFRRAMQRAEVVVATGGLGPTADDLTRDAIAGACGVQLVLDAPSLQHIEQLFARRGRTMPERNRLQAMLPQGACAIPNPHGTAPGIELTKADGESRRAALFALPGVPAEMKEMWHASVAPRLRSLLGSPRMIRHHVLKCFGMGESDVEQRLPDLIRRGRTPSVGITVSQATISLRISAEGQSDEECAALIAPTRQIILDCLGQLVFGEGEADELQHAVLRLLQRRELTLSVCEWGTQGRVARWLAESADAFPGCFRGAWIVSDSPSAVLAQSFADQRITEPGAMVAALAGHCRQHMNTDLALAVGPWPAENSTAAAGQIQLALATAEKTYSRSVATAGHPDLVRVLAAKRGLDYVRRWLSEAL